MKKITPLFFLSLSLFAQPTPVTVDEISYNDLPFDVRIENSGIYSIATFMVSGQQISLVTSDRKEIYDIKNDGTVQLRGSTDRKKRTENTINTFLSAADELIDNHDGNYFASSGKRVSLHIIGRSALNIHSDLSGLEKEIRLPFSGDLAYAELVGIDRRGNIFLLTEKYLSEVLLKIQREILVIDSNGNKLSTVEIPDIKYLSTEKDFRIDAEGNLFHLMTTIDRMLIFRWSGLTVSNSLPIKYPLEYSYSLHYNDFVTTNEAPGDLPQQPAAVASRSLALHIGESYAMHSYVCSASNLSPSDVTGPDGDVVKTPPWLLPGTNARVPYMWGGFSSIAQFNSGLQSGKFAGDINTNGVSSYSVGVDCSGFVSRCWQMTYHSSTSMMPSITTQYANWDSLKPGDAIHKIGHVRLFIERSANGGFRVVESAGRNWDVSYWTFAPSDLQGVYTPRFYNSMESNFSLQRPVLTSVITETNSTTSLAWNCDTTGLLGFRIYTSVDGNQWKLIKDEITVGIVSRIDIPITNEIEFFRISSVKNDAAKTESDWSNAMGASRIRSDKHYLIVDGFERLTASWQSKAHTFAVRYGTAVKNAGVSFSTMNNSITTTDTAALFKYDAVIWFLGDEGMEQETFSSQEQSLLRSYLQKGGKLFVTGSEVGWDLSQNGSATDKDFYSNYLKAIYKSDNASSLIVKDVGGKFYSGPRFNIGQVYVEDYPDEIDSVNGSSVALRYDNNKAAGVQYTGKFGTSQVSGKMVYLSFALETTANDSAFQIMIKNVIEFFSTENTSIVIGNDLTPTQFALYQNYPNPFNPTTNISFTLPLKSFVTLTVFDLVGRKITTLVSEELPSGNYSRQWNASGIPSGIYFYRLQSGLFTGTKKLLLVK